MKDATEAFQPLHADDPPLVAGYRLAARLGAGGMGRVYLSHTQGGRPVAIKVVRTELADDPAFRRRFRREIEAARRVRGAYTAELIDADADGAPPWLATLYVPGPSLAEAVARRGPLPVAAVLWLMAGVAEALAAIHAAGIVHRDLKPSNVLLAADGPRVIDFGISLASGITAQTATGATVGTPQFMAPEQGSMGDVTAATDVFALGQTAAFAALGKPLYGSGPSIGVLYRIVHSKPDLSLLPAQLRPLMARCLAADPAERATPAEIVEWCRQRLGKDADEGAGPAVWREITGPELTVPAPVPDPTPVHTLSLLAGHRPPGPQTARPGAGWPQGAWTQPPRPERQWSQRRRFAVISAVVMAGLLTLASVPWTVRNGLTGLIQRERASASHPERSGGSSASGSASVRAAGAGGGTPAPSSPSPSPTGPPRAEAYPFQMLDEQNSLDIKEPTGERKDRKGDIRFVCKGGDCLLESGTSMISMVYVKPTGSLESCRIANEVVHSHHLSLSDAAAGSEICVKRPSGDIAMLVVQVKSTALPSSGSSFVTVDMTVWRAPQGVARQ